MKIYLIYRPRSEHGRAVEDFARDFIRVQPTRSVELMNIDTRDGMAMAELYDITQYPAILAVRNDGQLLKSWSGSLPLMDELAYYAQD